MQRLRTLTRRQIVLVGILVFVVSCVLAFVLAPRPKTTPHATSTGGPHATATAEPTFPPLASVTPTAKAVNVSQAPASAVTSPGHPGFQRLEVTPQDIYEQWNDSPDTRCRSGSASVTATMVATMSIPFGPKTVTMTYSFPGTTAEIPMEQLGSPDQWTATIGPFPYDQMTGTRNVTGTESIEFHVTVVDARNNTATSGTVHAILHACEPV